MSNTQDTNQDKVPVSQGSWKDSYLVQAWLVLLMAAFYGGLLVAVQLSWGPGIAENKRLATYSRIPDLVPGATVENVKELPLVKDGKTSVAYRCLDANQATIGWVLPASGQGFADQIDLLVGLDGKAEKLTGLFVLNQKETPGLGNFIKEPYFRDQFNGTAADKPLTVVKGQDGNPSDNTVKALTGATISSRSVCEIVNNSLSLWKSELK